MDWTHEDLVPVTKGCPIFESSENERQVLVFGAIQVKAPSEDFKENVVKGALCVEEEGEDYPATFGYTQIAR